MSDYLQCHIHGFVEIKEPNACCRVYGWREGRESLRDDLDSVLRAAWEMFEGMSTPDQDEDVKIYRTLYDAVAASTEARRVKKEMNTASKEADDE